MELENNALEIAREILGVDFNSSDREIRNAFYKKIRQYHPDKTYGQEESAKLIIEAYNLITRRINKPTLLKDSSLVFSVTKKQTPFFQNNAEWSIKRGFYDFVKP